jgi:hypothetical protein
MIKTVSSLRVAALAAATLCLLGCPSEAEQACIDGDGEWGRNHCGDCVDINHTPKGPVFVCTDVEMDGCSCEDGLCWDGESCVPYE